ncbi:hypothetical protein ACFQ9H_05285 [Streptomyces sp. NPDC056517]|uniref:hypothetical protein n=1 Tax=unclassified Streptomyces TaxID=2593676 RepID=UPI00369B680F
MIRSRPATRFRSARRRLPGRRCAEKDWRGGWTKAVVTCGAAKGKTGWVRDDLVHAAAEGVLT